MDKYLSLVQIEVLAELAAEIKGYYYRYFEKHPEVDSTRSGNSDITKSYWQVVDIANSFMEKSWNEKELEIVTNRLREILNSAKELE
ncbi:MAG: hypothetical protein IJ217_05855 [Clostridia bacterium]|nr:hypothetical protein [Clostridia bacterium]